MATQLQPSATTGTLTGKHDVSRFAVAAILIGFVVVVIAAIGLVQTTQQPAADAPSVNAASGEVTDGWMPAIAAEQRAEMLDEAHRTRDGWSSALLKRQTDSSDASGNIAPDRYLSGDK